MYKIGSKQVYSIITTVCLLLGLTSFVYFSKSNLVLSLENEQHLVKRDGDFEFRIYSNNVRYSGARHRLPDERPWAQRRDGVIEAIKSRNTQYPTLIGLQECLHNQLEDVLKGLNKDAHDDWVHYGIGRDDGKEAGEYSPIIYNKTEWNLLNSTTRWLSSTPDVPSIYPGAATKRIVTITTFEHKTSGKRINYLNTHFDQKSADARQFSADEILRYISEIPNDYFTYLTGDFNAVSTDVSYTTIKQKLDDTDKVAYNIYNDNLFTYSGFAPDSKQNNIDFIWAPLNSNTPNVKSRVISHEVLDNLYNDYRFSDHRPITAHFKLWN